ncbi:antitoxin [Sulfolobus sp. E5-1-F]|uniref:antitoxin VapB family protein n=1 Tax=Sulfolobaceae TaxID=118883 RepID=UPI0012969F61|nr:MULTISPECIES: antitoxin VapB family protein [unclassified Sulfolobus]QGA54309.1 antitoxin [Sulfolobus sp. E5-1-F]QGA69361.1 antitoxin [Sulfolobus sp. E11-6]
MKTIMIRDDVYKKLVEIKGDRSFSEVIDELIEDSKEVRNRRLMRFFGILSEDVEIKRIREMLNEDLSRHVSSD